MKEFAFICLVVLFASAIYNWYILYTDRGENMDYIGAKDVAKKWGLSSRQIQKLCEAGRIENAFRIGSIWAIPANAEKPVDRRTLEGKREKNG
jgi:hypothetical protein